MKYRVHHDSVHSEDDETFALNPTTYEVWRNTTGPHGFGKTIDDAVLDLYRREENMQPYR